jgi:tetratricopeptide (TPR) repeat protein
MKENESTHKTYLSKVAALASCIALLAATALGAKHETWVEVRSPHFVIVSNAGEKQARKTAVQFEQIRTLFRRTIIIAANAPSPVITIFAVKDERSLRALLPEYWVKGHSHPAGIFFSRFNQFYAAIQLDAQGDNPYEALYHEYYHSLTMPYFPGLPVWLSEGLAEFFGNTRITDKQAEMGQPRSIWIEELRWIEEFRENRLIPLDVLLSVDHSSPYYNEQNKTSEFYAESWALTHYLMMGGNGAHRQLLANYLAALGQGATPQEAAAKAFGDLKRLELTLANYIGNYEFYHLTAPAPPKIPDAELQARLLSDAELDANLGGFAAVRGRPQDAKPILEEAVRLDPHLALAHQNLAIAELLDGQRSEALSSFSQAIALDPKNSLTRYLRAYLMDMSGGPALRDPQIEDDLRQSIALNPDFAPPYGLLAVVLSAGEENLPEALSFAEKAVSLEPGIAGFHIDLAQVFVRMRRYDDARVAALHARAAAVAPQERAEADHLFVLLQRVRDAQGGDRPTPGDALPPLQHRAKTNPTATAGNNGLAVSQGTQEVTGVVTQLSCNPAIQLQVTAPSGVYRLYTVPGGQLKIERASKPLAGFNPCSSMKGLRVTAQYEPDGAKGHSGKIEMLKILEPGDE